jgi:hypothetical protein
MVVLASVDASCRIDSQLVGSQLRFAVSNTGASTFLQQHVQPLENTHGLSDDLLLKKNSVGQLLVQRMQASTLPLTVLLIFCAEGDNIPDTIVMSRVLAQHLELTNGRRLHASRSRR